MLPPVNWTLLNPGNLNAVNDSLFNSVVISQHILDAEVSGMVLCHLITEFGCQKKPNSSRMARWTGSSSLLSAPQPPVYWRACSLAIIENTVFLNRFSIFSYDYAFFLHEHSLSKIGELITVTITRQDSRDPWAWLDPSVAGEALLLNPSLGLWIPRTGSWEAVETMYLHTRSGVWVKIAQSS